MITSWVEFNKKTVMITLIISSLNAPVLLVFCMRGTETSLLQGKTGRSVALDLLILTDCSFLAQGTDSEKDTVKKMD